MSDEEAQHMQGAPMGEAAVDRAMREWDTLAQNPSMMQEMLESFQDPEVQAKAKEMVWIAPDMPRATAPPRPRVRSHALRALPSHCTIPPSRRWPSSAGQRSGIHASSEEEAAGDAT